MFSFIRGVLSPIANAMGDVRLEIPSNLFSPISLKFFSEKNQSSWALTFKHRDRFFCRQKRTRKSLSWDRFPLLFSQHWHFLTGLQRREIRRIRLWSTFYINTYSIFPTSQSDNCQQEHRYMQWHRFQRTDFVFVSLSVSAHFSWHIRSISCRVLCVLCVLR